MIVYRCISERELACMIGISNYTHAPHGNIFFNECENVYINALKQSIPFNELENCIKTYIRNLSKNLFYDIMNMSRKLA